MEWNIDRRTQTKPFQYKNTHTHTHKTVAYKAQRSNSQSKKMAVRCCHITWKTAHVRVGAWSLESRDAYAFHYNRTQSLNQLN